ncbi:MAG: ACR3 family arsenite efflux transporter [Myxococcota bacterium]|nr:ACR3 family arsenite efflux transporter [Myxococcota bacterium]
MSHGAGSVAREIGAFKAYLPVWILLSIALGLALGARVPFVFSWLEVFEIGSVNLAIAVLVWLMIFPTMVKVDFTKLGRASGWGRGLALTLTTNWLVKPFSMAALATLFLGVWFAPWVAPEEAEGYVAGLILLGAAPCTGMVFVWSRLTGGDATFTVVQVSVNDLVLLVAFAPLVAILLGVASVAIPWTTLALATAIFVVWPLVAGALVRRHLLARGGELAVSRFAGRFAPLTSFGLLLLVVVLFGLQAGSVLGDPLAVALIAVPVTVQAYLIFAVAYGWAFAWRLPSSIAAPAALIGTSNFFELAAAVAIGLFGIDSPAALATVVGVLVEVPVMLTLVKLANATRWRIDARAVAPA